MIVLVTAASMIQHMRSRAFVRMLVLGVVPVLVGLSAWFAPGTAEAALAKFPNTPLPAWRAEGVGFAALTVGNTAYVGGSFSTVRSPDGATVVNRGNLAAFDLRTGALLTGFQANTNDTVRSIAYDGTRLYIGGSFSTVNGLARQRVAALDPITGAVSTSWVANASSNVSSLAVAAGRLYVAGSFTTIKGVARSRLAALNLADASVTSFAPQVNDRIGSLAVSDDGSRVYVGGSYTAINGDATRWLTKLDGAGNVVPTTWASLDGEALDLELSPDGTRLAVGTTGNQGAWYNTTTGARLWRQRCDGDAQAVWIIGDSMFTGFHDTCEGNATVRLTSNATATGGRDADFTPSFDRFWGVRAIAGDASALLIAGDFTSISGVPAQGFAIFSALPAPPPPAVQLAANATWRYLDNGTTPAPSWTGEGFDDSAWASGPAQLGFGDGDESTVVSFGPNPNAKFITTYFRTTFNASAVPSTLTLDLLDDDGAVVYVNGVEVARDNLPTGTITGSTRASTNRSGAAESEIHSFSIPPSLVHPGVNTIAAEVHQDAPSSSDLSFQAALSSTA
jgi:hypothetical protein